MAGSPHALALYLDKLKQLAEPLGVDDQTFSGLSLYAENLFRNDCPVIFDETHFSKLVGYHRGYLYACANGTESFYREFSIKKKGGGLRKISEPLAGLKEVQRWLLDHLLTQRVISPAAKAYSAGCNIKSNAKFHVGQATLVRLDVKNFFPSIRIDAVFEIFAEMGYTKQLATLFSRLCCLNECLPQGAPTSAALSNIFLAKTDALLLGWAKSKGYRYTRYADDLIFSGEISSAKEVIHHVRGVLASEGLHLNEKKIAVLRRGARQVVTGLVVNEKLNVPRSLRRQLRQAVFYIKKYGLDGHLNRIGEVRRNYIDHLIGVGEFITWVDKKNDCVKADIMFLRDLKHSYLNEAGIRSPKAPEPGSKSITAG